MRYYLLTKKFHFRCAEIYPKMQCMLMLSPWNTRRLGMRSRWNLQLSIAIFFIIMRWTWAIRNIKGFNHWGSHQNQICCSLTLISGGFKAIWDLQIDTLVSLQGAVWLNLENTANDLSVMATPAMIRTCPIPRRLIARSYKTYTHKWNEKICKKLPRYRPGP